MFNYEKLYEPYTKSGATLEGSINWLKKSSNADKAIVEQVVSETMEKLSRGVDFTGNCNCGCGMTGRDHTKIEHYMLTRVLSLKGTADAAYLSVLKENQKSVLSAQLNQLSTFEKEYNKMINGTFWSNLFDWSKSPVLNWLKGENHADQKNKKRLENIEHRRIQQKLESGKDAVEGDKSESIKA